MSLHVSPEQLEELRQVMDERDRQEKPKAVRKLSPSRVAQPRAGDLDAIGQRMFDGVSGSTSWEHHGRGNLFNLEENMEGLDQLGARIYRG